NNSTNQQFNNYTNINSGLQPSDVGLLFSPNAAHWAELTRPFRAFSQIVNGHLVFNFQFSAFSKQLNNSTTIHFDRISISLFL
ncbi:MAG: hypothetical protein ACFNL2_11490, partial [Tannerella forsythia]|uniref:hypothetical protein n=1 Tax=Tannerella forsythia TaxID=28112 RepID=UPI0036162AE9